MSGLRARSITSLVGALFVEGTTNGLSDEQLIARFLSQRDEAAEFAFAALVERHGPMVLGVCRSALRDQHEAEDAFQATFLVFARKAGSLCVSVQVYGPGDVWVDDITAIYTDQPPTDPLAVGR